MDHLRLFESWNPRPQVWVGRDCQTVSGTSPSSL